MKVTGKTQILGVIGDPISHSFSPELHNYISKTLNNNYIYSAYHVLPENLKEAMEGMRALNIRGINVTSPHKIEVMQYLDEISPDAKLLGAVNTIVNDNGKLVGYNTDCDGFYMSLVRAGITVKDSNILVMGCGGVVKPTLIRLTKEKPQSITLVNRTKEKAVAIAKEIYELTGYRVSTDVTSNRFDIVINTTTAGMGNQADMLPWDNISDLNGIDVLDGDTSAVDMIYNPPCTRFLELAKRKGAKTINGLDMLIYQGIIAYERFTGVKVPENIIDLVRKEVFNV